MPPGAAAGRSNLAVAGFILGIVGVIPCFWGCGVFQILAIVFGVLGQREIEQSGGLKTNPGQARAALILGIIGLVLSVLYWILYAVGAIHIDFQTS